MDSILEDIKQMVTGFVEEDDGFDLDLITAINNAFMYLYQQNVGYNGPYQIINKNQTWNDYVRHNAFLKNGSILECLPMIKQYIVLKTRMLFDPPTNSSIEKAYRDSIGEIEYRLNIEWNDYKERM